MDADEPGGGAPGAARALGPLVKLDELADPESELGMDPGLVRDRAEVLQGLVAEAGWDVLVLEHRVEGGEGHGAIPGGDRGVAEQGEERGGGPVAAGRVDIDDRGGRAGPIGGRAAIEHALQRGGGVPRQGPQVRQPDDDATADVGIIVAEPGDEGRYQAPAG